MSNAAFDQQLSRKEVQSKSVTPSGSTSEDSEQGDPESVLDTALASLETPEIQVFATKVDAAWNVLHGRYASRIPQAQIDHLFACFVFGLTSPVYGDAEPSVHFAACRALVSPKMTPERAHAALHAVPVPTEPWVEAAYQSVERRGIDMGLAITNHSRVQDVRAAGEAGTSRRTAVVEEELS
ncbi:hypothetical protein [Chelativorans sp. M5D2P16]|uniref:hypothetical protein n=1 Tax=Chelativorans sp. M5D2P16 TaxID=3095678 RepID=UPI002ACA4BA8|nr:hypothetical protein [Chelativorans sp. M5D2P16]MDZ5699830.1 hypothetical protein [Chelativorans sp. M5D2P16]